MRLPITVGMFIKIAHPSNTSYLYIISEGAENQLGEIKLGVFLVREILVDHRTNAFQLMDTDYATEYEIGDWLVYSSTCEGKQFQL